jgi:hypothetical protein
MKPTAMAGDLVLVHPVDQKDLVVGDIIQYSRNNMLIFHRVKEI